MRYFVLSLTLLLSPAAISAAEVATLTGTVHTGDIVSIANDQITLKENGETITLPTAQALSIRWENDHPAVGQEPRAESQLMLRDGSQLTIHTVNCDGRAVDGISLAAGEVSVPHASVKAVLFRKLDDKTRGQWKKLVDKTSSDDMLVVRKGDTLDFLAGVVTEYDDSEVKFLYQGSEIPVKREKVFGLIHPSSDPSTGNAVGQVKTVHGDTLLVDQLSLNGETLSVQVPGGKTWLLPLTQLVEIDFSMGRVVYLSDLDPDTVQHTPFFDTVWTFQRDRTNVGAPLRLAGTEYAKGLWIHSKTELTYRLAGDYTRFQAMIGIDDAVAANGLGNVRVVLKADDTVVFDEEVAALDAPRSLEVDVTGARFLHILVDFGTALDISDHLVLGDARLIK